MREEYVYNKHDEAIGVVEERRINGMTRYIPYELCNDYSRERLKPQQTYRDAVWEIRKQGLT